MKWYHYAMAFGVVSAGVFFISQAKLVVTITREDVKRTEYQCLVSAVNSAVDVVFEGDRNIVTEAGLKQAEETFFQTLSVLHDGVSDASGVMKWMKYVPCLVVFGENGYYVFGADGKGGYGWSEKKEYENGEIPGAFFLETENVLSEYHNEQIFSYKAYRMEGAEEGIWEKSLTKACVFAVFAPPLPEALTQTEGVFLCAATGKKQQAYYVTSDNYCHLPSCPRCQKGKIVAWYRSQKDSAMAGALPCGICLK